MENQENTQEKKTRTLIHLQVSGDYSQEELSKLVQEFHQTYLEGGAIGTPENVTANLIETDQDLNGLILTPKMTAKELATVVVSALQGFDIGQGNKPTDDFDKLSQEDQAEILAKIQMVMRFGGLPESENNVTARTRDAIFVSVVRALAKKMWIPQLTGIVKVTRVAIKAGEKDEECTILDLKQGDVFKHGEHTLVAQSDPYVNWIADPLPQISLDAKVYEAPQETASKEEKKEVQSKPSKAKSTRKK